MRRVIRESGVWSLVTAGTLALPLLLLPGLAAAQETAACPAPVAGVVFVRGEVERPLDLRAADLAGMPRERVQVTDREGAIVEYEGVPVRHILVQAGVPMESLRGGMAAAAVVAEASDGYRALFAIAELDESFSDRITLLVDALDGAALPETEGPFRIIMDGESRHSRWIRQVSCLRVVRP